MFNKKGGVKSLKQRSDTSDENLPDQKQGLKIARGDLEPKIG